MNRIEKKFKQLRATNKKAFVAFITAGYPSLNITEKLVLELDRIGVDIVELGVPFSDPMADGPVIQEASKAALKKNVNLNDILRLVKKCRRFTEMPICLMTYYNPIFCFGEEKFSREAQAAGVDAVIVPDLPPEEARSFIKYASRHNLDTIFFLAPTSSRERIKLVCRASKGFIYYVSLTGVTGPRAKLPPGITEHIKLIKKNTAKPVCVGFGVSKPEQISRINKIADGVIVGSAIIKKIKENIGNPNLIRKVSRFICKLKGK